MTPQIDPKRTVKATPRVVFDPDGGAPDGIDVEPGVCQPREPYRGYTHRRLAFACPGCASWGSIPCRKAGEAFDPRESNGWEITAGTLDDPTTLTLSPSIHCVGCCGWHGYLTDGVFRSC